jgi:aspartate carbamoyltransferase catalytic subunit
VKHIVAVDQFDRAWLESIFTEADRLRNDRNNGDPLKGKILATLFYEPSTRTRLSFEIISTENAREFSSAIKGETVEDTVRIVSGYADGIVIRHFEMGAAARAATASPVPIINGGDGPGEHPTQALLDLYTIHNELGRIDDLKLALVGDLRFGRAARSLALLFRQANNVELVFVAPDAVPMGDDIKDALDVAGVAWREEPNLEKAMGEVDVVYQTRIQKERFATPEEYKAAKGIYIITPDTMKALPDHGIVMHPLPRVDEIHPEVDNDPRAAYFRQAHNGVYVRMALLNQLLGSEVAGI